MVLVVKYIMKAPTTKPASVKKTASVKKPAPATKPVATAKSLKQGDIRTESNMLTPVADANDKR